MSQNQKEKSTERYALIYLQTLLGKIRTNKSRRSFTWLCFIGKQTTIGRPVFCVLTCRFSPRIAVLFFFLLPVLGWSGLPVTRTHRIAKLCSKKWVKRAAAIATAIESWIQQHNQTPIGRWPFQFGVIWARNSLTHCHSQIVCDTQVFSSGCYKSRDHEVFQARTY